MLNNKIIPSHEGTPQGSIMSPVISNIVLHQFDIFMEKTKNKFNIGTKRRTNPKYHSLANSRLKSKNFELKQHHLREMINMPSRDLMDPNFKRLMYVRYADDFIILIIGSMNDCFSLRRKIKDFLKNKLGLELNIEKTSITSLTKGFDFLGAKLIQRGKVVVKIKGLKKSGIRKRSLRRLSVLAPVPKMIDKLVHLNFARRNHLNKTLPKARRDLVNLTHYEIITFYNARIKGLLNYYSFAGNYDQIRRVI